MTHEAHVTLACTPLRRDTPGVPPERSTEHQRLRGPDARRWRHWGPYLSDRSWGTVREDYSAKGDAWAHLPHDLARSKAYRWGDDGIAGFCDRYQILCWSLALWNERDPILKERLFGVEPTEGNHGEDVKECYFYTDGTPSHSSMRMLYKYPQAEFPYAQLIAENRRRAGQGAEYELIDTGLFDERRYFDVQIDIAKDGPDSVIFRVTAHNRGPDAAPIHLIPHLWFRNTWSWDGADRQQPIITIDTSHPGLTALLADDSVAPPLHGLLADSRLGPQRLEFPNGAELLFTDNETNGPRVYGRTAQSRSLYVKDAFHRRIVNGELGAVNPAMQGTRACARQRFLVPAGGSAVMRMRLGPAAARIPQRRRAPLHRQRDQRPTRLRPHRPVTQPLRQRRLPPAHREWRTRRGEPGHAGHSRVRTTTVPGARRRLRGDANATRARQRLADVCRRDGLDRHPPPRRGRRVLRRAPPREGHAHRASGAAPGLGRDDLVEAELPL